MPVRSLAAALVAAAVALVAAAPAAHAAPWKQVTASNGQNIDQVGLLRTADGVLHVAWEHQSGPSTEDLLHTTISPAGRIGATAPIAAGWATLDNPALVPAAGGIRAFFGGIHTTDAEEPNQDLNTALSTDGGQTWALQPGDVAAPGAAAYASPISAAVLADGTPLEAWYGSSGVWVHPGLSPAAPDHDFQGSLGNYGYDDGIAAAGETATLAWYSNATGHLGVYAQSVAPDGSPLGALEHMPSTSNMSVGMIGRTPIVARPGGGFYVAYATGYPSLDKVRVWRVGAGTAPVVASTPHNDDSTATIAATPDGRLWVAWQGVVNEHPVVLARRSNRSGRTWGAVVDAGAPKHGASLYRVDASATRSAVDVFGAFSRGTSSDVATFHRRLEPGLTLKASPAKVRRGRPTGVTFRVLDAGDPVKGAKVTAGGARGATDKHGEVTLRLTIKRATGAVAGHSGYSDARRRIGVKG
jgi:hypothetical protein